MKKEDTMLVLIAVAFILAYIIGASRDAVYGAIMAVLIAGLFGTTVIKRRRRRI